MKTLTPRLSLAEEWRLSSDQRRAAVLRLLYNLVILAILPVLFGFWPELRRVTMPYFAGTSIMLFNLAINPLFGSYPSLSASESQVKGSPNARFVAAFFTAINKFKGGANWERGFYRFCIRTLNVMMFTLGCFLAIFYCPLIATEAIVFSRNDE